MKLPDEERVEWGEKSPHILICRGLIALGFGAIVIHTIFNLLDLLLFIEQHGAWEFWYRFVSGGK